MSLENGAALMQQLSMAAMQLSEKDVERVLANRASLSIVIKPKRVDSTIRNEFHASHAESDFLPVLQHLETLSARNDGYVLLKDFKRLELEKLARQVYIAVDSSMNKEKLIERIIEKKIGLRLRQNAFAEIMSAA